MVGSSIARESDDVLYTWAGPEIAVATTKGYSTQISLMYLLALKLGHARGYVSDDMLQTLVAELEQIPEYMEKLLKRSAMGRIGKNYAFANDVFLIGRGIDYAVAMELSLKLKEISYIHSEKHMLRVN